MNDYRPRCYERIPYGERGRPHIRNMETENMKMKITQASLHDSAAIARLIMLAMNHDCCQYFAGEHHTLADFERMMTRLVERDDSQYSHRNTLVAHGEDSNVMGILVCYDGKDLRKLRQAFVEEAFAAFGRDFSSMDDETEAGELYLDSLAVEPRYRHRGVATALLKEAIGVASRRSIPAVGLLVDQGNPSAERLYQNLGFKRVNECRWGGHPMFHLQYICTPKRSSDDCQ